MARPVLALDIQATQTPTGPSDSGALALGVAVGLLRTAAPGERITLVCRPWGDLPEELGAAVARSPGDIGWAMLPLPGPGACACPRAMKDAYESLVIDPAIDGAVYLGLGIPDPEGGPAAPGPRPAWAARTAYLLHDLAPALAPEELTLAPPPFDRSYRARLASCAEADVLLVPTDTGAADLAYCIGPSPARTVVVGMAPPLRSAGRGSAAGPAGTQGEIVWRPGPGGGWDLVSSVLSQVTRSARRRIKVVPYRGGLGPATLLYVSSSAVADYDLGTLDAAASGIASLVAASADFNSGVAGPEATFDPADPDAARALIERALGDDLWREQLAARQSRAVEGLDWSQVARRVRAALEDGAVAAPARRRHRPRARITVTGPLPPIASGITKYIEDQTRAAAGRVDLRWVGSDPSDRGRLWWHHLGNHRLHHTDQFGLIAAHGGVVELHDVHMPFVVPSLLAPPEAVAVPVDLQRRLRQATRSGAAPEQPEAALLSWLAERSSRLVVHSYSAAGMVRRLVPGGPDPVVVPHGAWISTESRNLALARGRALPSRLYAVVPGFVGPAKWPEGIVAAVATITPGLRPLLVFAGRCPPHLAATIERLAGEAGVEVLITGYLPAPEFDAWLARAAVAVVGRLVGRGETSGALLRAARVGTPTVLAGEGAIADLPVAGTLVAVVGRVPSAVGAALSAVLASPVADPLGAARRQLFESSLGELRTAWSWEPTLELMGRGGP